MLDKLTSVLGTSDTDGASLGIELGCSDRKTYESESKNIDEIPLASNVRSLMPSGSITPQNLGVKAVMEMV